jgi:hypothetical protein
MSTKFSMTRDINGYNGFGLVFSDQKFSASILASTNTILTVPSSAPMGGSSDSVVNNYFIALFSFQPSSSVWVSNNNTAEIPSGSSFVSTTSELNPSARLVKSGDVINFFSSSATLVGVTFYSLS